MVLQSKRQKFYLRFRACRKSQIITAFASINLKHKQKPRLFKWMQDTVFYAEGIAQIEIL
jgi:hypothetical protein